MGIETFNFAIPGKKKLGVKYRMRIRIRCEDGLVFQRSSYHATYPEAKAAEEQAIKDARDQHGQKEKLSLLFQPTVARLLDSYAKEFSSKKADSTSFSEGYLLRGTIPNTEINVRQCDEADGTITLSSDDPGVVKSFEGMAKFGDIKIGQVRKSHLLAYIAVRKTLVTGDSIRKEVQLISSAYKKLPVLFPKVSREVSNPRLLLDKNDIPKPNAPRERLATAAERKLILEQANKLKSKELLAIIRLELGTAMRRSEILRMEWQHIDLESMTIFIPKTKNGRARHVPLTDDAVATLSSLEQKEKGKLFKLGKYGVNSAWQRLLKKTGLHGQDLHMHDLRHNALTEWAGQGLNTPQIASLSGNADMRNFEHRHGSRIAAFALARRGKGQKVSMKDLQAIGGHETAQMTRVYVNIDTKELAGRPVEPTAANDD